MRRVCCPRSPHLQPDFQVVLIDDIHEPVAPDGVIVLEVAPVHAPKLDSTYSWIFLPDTLDVLQAKDSLATRAITFDSTCL